MDDELELQQRPVCAVGELLPRADEAIVEPRRLMEYALDPSKDVGSHKARKFRESLGIYQDDWEYLRQALLRGIQEWHVQDIRLTRYGPRYSVPMAVMGLNGMQVVVTTGWEIDEDGKPRLLSTYIRKP